MASRSPHVLPRSEESERAVLAALLLDPRALPAVAQQLHAGDFYAARHRVIYQAMLALARSDQPIDLRTLQARLESFGSLDGLGGLAYLASLDLDLPDIGRLDAYVAIVRERAARRRLIELAGDISRRALAGEQTANELASWLHGQALRLLDDAAARRPSSFVDALLDMEDALERPQRLPTDIACLDRRWLGLHLGGFVVLAGRTAAGKTAGALSIVRNIAMRGERVLYLSWEMTRTEIAQRLACAEAKISLRELTDRRVLREQFQAVTAAAHRLQHLPLRILDDPGRTAEQAEATIRAEHSREPLSLVVIDYLQVVQLTGRGENRNQALGAFCRALFALARSLRVTVLALSQLTRPPKAVVATPRRPELSDLRDCGEIEQVADQVAFVWRAEVDSGRTDGDSLFMAKDRHLGGAWEERIAIDHGLLVGG